MSQQEPFIRCGMPYVGPWHPDAVGSHCSLPVDHEGRHQQGSCYWANHGRGPTCSNRHDNNLNQECAVWWLAGTEEWIHFHPRHPIWCESRSLCSPAIEDHDCPCHGRHGRSICTHIPTGVGYAMAWGRVTDDD